MDQLADLVLRNTFIIIHVLLVNIVEIKKNQDSLMNKMISVFTITFDQFNASLLKTFTTNNKTITVNKNPTDHIFYFLFIVYK